MFFWQRIVHITGHITRLEAWPPKRDAENAVPCVGGLNCLVVRTQHEVSDGSRRLPSACGSFVASSSRTNAREVRLSDSRPRYLQMK